MRAFDFYSGQERSHVILSALMFGVMLGDGDGVESCRDNVVSF